MASDMKTALFNFCVMLLVVVVLCVNPTDEHRFLQSAETHGMTDGEYVYMTIDQTPPANVRTPWIDDGVVNNEVKHIYKHVLQVLNLHPRFRS